MGAFHASHDAGENEAGGDTPDLQAVQCGENPALQEGYREIIIATDAGREGELVARWILAKADCHKPIKRLWISSVTDKAIRDGFAHLKNGHDYDDLYRAAQARAEADWLVGMNGTRALTCKYNAQLSCGRVQTPTLAMIARREQEIREFKPEDYYGITLQAGNVRWTWRDGKSGSLRTFKKERAQEIQTKAGKSSLTITKVSRKPKKTYAPGLYDLTTLQREANQKYGFSAKETLNIMQRLYENHKVLTYQERIPGISERMSFLPLKNVFRHAEPAPTGNLPELLPINQSRPMQVL